ncbi:hypothetical protein BDY19DRAFT_453229 [Irpex rosettiformis]|uniref:Uncharacterized protein n=1 Tax=Irpex rosettiformis TaxID=378272 RepID=A0ACB8TTL7_9APHY|nr:hypothetical protein BDY19DRAFT_453229 [Irpex rosettiformis]
MDTLRRTFKPRRKPTPLVETKRTSRRFRDSVHVIPTPGVEARRPEEWPLTWKVFGLAALMIVIGIAVEIALAISNENQGFPIPQRNIFAFTHVQVSFLTSFFPTMFILPLSLLWNVSDYVLRWYQPYIVLSEGNARAEESLMMDYIMNNRVMTLLKVTKRRQYIIYFSMVTALASDLFQPLAGGLLSVKAVYTDKPITVQGTTTLGLIPDFKSLNAFLAAAGFTEAAAFQGLPDPPFVDAGWASAQFVAEGSGTMSSVSADTTGIRTKANCAAPSSMPKVDTSNPANFSVTASLVDGCSSVVTFDPTSAEQQYGTAPANLASCGLAPDFPQQFAPVMFWFYHNNTQNQPQAGAVICRPTLELFNIVATVGLPNNNLSVTIKDTYTAPNTVSGGTLNGKIFNAVLFGDLPGNDKFIQARATAVGSQIPGAIFRFASQDPTSLQQSFDALDGFVNLTSQIYTQHLSVTAKTVYFIPGNQTLSGRLTSLEERLIMDKFAGHALAAILLVVGFIGIAFHIAHRQVRRRLHLTAHPGTIASIVALTSHSGFGELLFPFDDKQTIRAKLNNLRFSLDRRTGAIVADEIEDGDEVALNTMNDPYLNNSNEGSKMDLSRVESRAPLLTDSAGASMYHGSSPPSPPQHGLPYEVEPLVLDHSRQV